MLVVLYCMFALFWLCWTGYALLTDWVVLVGLRWLWWSSCPVLVVLDWLCYIGCAWLVVQVVLAVLC